MKRSFDLYLRSVVAQIYKASISMHPIHKARGKCYVFVPMSLIRNGDFVTRYYDFPVSVVQWENEKNLPDKRHPCHQRESPFQYQVSANLACFCHLSSCNSTLDSSLISYSPFTLSLSFLIGFC